MNPKNPKGSLINSYDLDNPIATEMRRLLHKIKTAGKTNEVKTVLITSSVIGEGKSTICSYLAMTSARKQMHTLMIDCDLRRPILHKMFDLPREKGIVEALSEGIRIRDTIKKTTLDKLDLITAGRISSAPAELFEAHTIGEYLNELKFYYDLILVDCAPVLPVSDPMILATVVDGVIMAIKAGSTQRELIKRATDIISGENSRMLGLVVNNMSDSLPYYYDSSHYSYQYQTSESVGKKRKEDTAQVNEPGNSNSSQNPVSGKNQISG